MVMFEKDSLCLTVIPPYHEVYTTLNEKIVQRLLMINIDGDEAAIQTLIDSFVCASRHIQNKLGIPAKASKEILNSLDE
jgi:hypothetical protein